MQVKDVHMPIMEKSEMVQIIAYTKLAYGECDYDTYSGNLTVRLRRKAVKCTVENKALAVF